MTGPVGNAAAGSASRRPLLRLVFVVYACAVFIGTHWPALSFEGPVPRSDLVLHIAAFGVWSALCIAAAWFGAPLSARNILLAALVALAYSVFDETTQAIPFIHRNAAWDDWALDTAGIAAATTAAMILAARRRARAERGGEPMTNG